jgi:hypothetical protein
MQRSRMATARLRSVHGLTVGPPSHHVADSKAADEISGVFRKCASAQAGGRKEVLTPECFWRLSRQHSYCLLAVLRRAVEGVPKTIERKNVRGIGAFCRFSL